MDSRRMEDCPLTIIRRRWDVDWHSSQAVLTCEFGADERGLLDDNYRVGAIDGRLRVWLRHSNQRSEMRSCTVQHSHGHPDTSLAQRTR